MLTIGTQLAATREVTSDSLAVKLPANPVLSLLLVDLRLDRDWIVECLVNRFRLTFNLWIPMRVPNSETSFNRTSAVPVWSFPEVPGIFLANFFIEFRTSLSLFFLYPCGSWALIQQLCLDYSRLLKNFSSKTFYLKNSGTLGKQCLERCHLLTLPAEVLCEKTLSNFEVQRISRTSSRGVCGSFFLANFDSPACWKLWTRFLAPKEP